MANVSTISPTSGADTLPQPWAAERRERTAIRNVTLLLLVRGLIVAGGVASAAIVPRTLGPATYGRYDLITMLTFWFSMLGGLGLGQVLSRQTAQLEAEGADDKLRHIFGSFLAVRSVAGVLGAGLYFAIAALWLRDLDWTILLVLAIAVVLRGPGGLCYSLFLGQGRIGRWALPDVTRQWGSVAFALPGYLLGGLPGAVCGYLLSETIIFAVAMLGARRAFSWATVRFNLRASAPLLGMGLAFYASEMVVAAIERSGAVLIRAVTLDYAQVGLFGVSYQIFMAALLSTGQITNSFVPLLTVLRTRGETAEMRSWVERLVKWLAITGMLGLLGSLLLGRDVVPFVLGRAYDAVYPNVVVMSAALLFLPLTHTCSLLALVHDRPGVLFRAALLKLVCFWALGVPLVERWGSFGACLAMGGATAAQATYLLLRHADLVGPALRRWSFVVGTGLALAPLAWLRGSLPLNFALFVLAAAIWLLVLRLAGVISARELRGIYRALGSGRQEGSA